MLVSYWLYLRLQNYGVKTIRKVSENYFISYRISLDNPFNEFHINAKYVNSSAVAAEVYHVANRVKVTDALVALRLNTSHLLHSRLHWSPTALADIKVHIPFWANRKVLKKKNNGNIKNAFI